MLWLQTKPINEYDSSLILFLFSKMKLTRTVSASLLMLWTSLSLRIYILEIRVSSVSSGVAVTALRILSSLIPFETTSITMNLFGFNTLSNTCFYRSLWFPLTSTTPFDTSILTTLTGTLTFRSCLWSCLFPFRSIIINSFYYIYKDKYYPSYKPSKRLEHQASSNSPLSYQKGSSVTLRTPFRESGKLD